MPDTTFEETIFEALTDDDDRAGGLSEKALAREPRNFLRHAASLTMTKVADGLLDPKLVLSWLLGTLGASAAIVGLLVPVREAGALLPQLLAAPRVEAMAIRKWAWAGGSLVQGLAAAGIVAAGLTLEGAAAGWTIVILLAVLAVARSICSVSYKDILGKTVGQSRRGTVTGFASSAASTGVIVFALALMILPGARMVIVIGALTLAAALWLLAAALFSTLDELPSKPQAQPSARKAVAQLALLREDPELALFIASRGFLTATALAPPFLVLMASDDGSGAFAQLGALVLASAVASLVSSYVWGRLADRSSRMVLVLAGLAAAATLVLAVLLSFAGLMGGLVAAPAVLFALMIAYHGVRQGRSTYLVDMAPSDQRAAYTAVSNTVIGVALLASGGFGALAALGGPEATIALFALMCLAGAGVAWRMSEATE